MYPLQTILDPLYYGKAISNYYDYDNSFIDNHNVYSHSFNNSFGDRFYPKLIAEEFDKQLMLE